MVLAILLVALPLSYGEAKSYKIAKDITFSGAIVKQTPNSYGTLTTQKEEQERAAEHNSMTTEILQSGNRNQQSFVNHIYSGVMHSNAEDYVEAMMSIHFLSNNTCRMKLTTKVKGSDDIPTLQIVQMMMEAQGDNVKEDVFEYTFRNGTIIFKNTTDRFKVLNGGKELRWYIESNDKLAKKFNAILKRIK